MTVKTAVSFTERHHQYARKKVEEGSFASVSSVVASALEQAMLDEEEREASLEAMTETIRRRMKTPRDEFVVMDESDTVFDEMRELITSR